MAQLPKRKHLRRIPVWLPLDRPVIYFVTACCRQRQRIFADVAAARMAVECLQRCALRHDWEIPQLCLMPDHVHLFAAPLQEREQPLSDLVRAWKSCVTLRLRRGPVWQAEFFDHLLRTDESAEEKWQYVRMNPVRAGLCEDPEEYPWTGTPEQILSHCGPRPPRRDTP